MRAVLAKAKFQRYFNSSNFTDTFGSSDSLKIFFLDIKSFTDLRSTHSSIESDCDGVLLGDHRSAGNGHVLEALLALLKDLKKPELLILYRELKRKLREQEP